ncbi:unnamed protein product, partial [Owenia fusiformis]
MPKSKQQVQEKVNRMWPTYKRDQEKLNSYMNKTTSADTCKSKITNYFSPTPKPKPDNSCGIQSECNNYDVNNNNNHFADPMKCTAGVRQMRHEAFETVTCTENQLTILKSFLRVLQPESELKVLEHPDLISAPAFIKPLVTVATSYLVFMNTRDNYDQLYVKQKKGTIVNTEMAQLSKMMDIFKQKLIDIDAIKLDLSKMLFQTAQRKANHISELMAQIGSIDTKINDVLKRLRSLISIKSRQADPHPNKTPYFVQCSNNKSLTWDDAMVNLIESNVQLPGPLDSSDILKCASNLRETTIMKLNDLVEGPLKQKYPDSKKMTYGLNLSICKNLQEHLPVMIVRQAFSFVLVNIHELYYNATLFEDLVNIDIADEQAKDTQNKIQRERTRPGPKPGHGGRQPLHKKYPNIVDGAVNYMMLHGFAAQQRRRTDVATSVGVTTKDLRKHLIETIPDLTTISTSTVSRLMMPTNLNFKSAKYYKGVIRAKVPAKNNSLKKDHPDLQFIRSQIATANEIATQYQHNVHLFSCDDKNKVAVGTLAVSRYHQIKKFFLEGDEPNYQDHDFPFPNAKIIPSGYLLLDNSKNCKQRSRSCERVNMKNRQVR